MWEKERIEQNQTGDAVTTQAVTENGMQTPPVSTTVMPVNGVYSLRNLVIEGVKYLYIEYEMRGNDSIRLRSLVLEEKNLIIPLRIQGYRIVEVGARRQEDSPGQDSGHALCAKYKEES